MKHLNMATKRQWWRRVTVFSLANLIAFGPMFQGIGISKISTDCAPRFPAANPVIVAHRASTYSFPENSLGAVNASSRLDAVEGLEFDVRSTKDGVQVLMHDSTLDRTTNGTGDVASLSYAQLRSHRLTSGTKAYQVRWSKQIESVPKLSAAIRAVPTSKIAFVEMKFGSDPKKILTVISQRPEKSVYVISSSRRYLAAVKQQAPGLRRGLVWGDGESVRLWELVEETRPSAIILDEASATDSLLSKLDSRGIDTFLWTVNNPKTMKKWMLEPKVTGIITDYPEIAAQIRTSLRCGI